jgi:hypothetical protein
MNVEVCINLYETKETLASFMKVNTKQIETQYLQIGV